MRRLYASFDEYGLRYLPRHLARDRRFQKLREILLEYDWLQTKLNTINISALIDDFELLQDALNRDSELLQLRNTLRLSAHILLEDPSQLPIQLWGRLAFFGELTGSIQKLLKDTFTDSPRLRPLLPYLTIPGGPLMQTLIGHGARVNGLAAFGSLIVSCSSDCTLKIWDIRQGVEVKTLKGHSGEVYAVVVTPDGKTIISGSSDKTLIVWDLNTGNQIRTLKGHSGLILSLAVTPNGKFAISGSADKTLKVWDLQEGTEVRTLRGHQNVVNSVAVDKNGKYIVSGSSDKTIKIWQIDSERELRTLKGMSGAVKVVKVIGGMIVSGSQDGIINFWDLELEGRQVARPVAVHADQITAIMPILNDQDIVTGSLDHTLKIWDLFPREKPLRILIGHTAGVTSAIALPNISLIASGSLDKTIRIWDISRLETPISAQGHTAAITGLSVTSDGTGMLSVSNDGMLKLHNIPKGNQWVARSLLSSPRQTVRTTIAHPASVNSVAISADKSFIATGLSNGKIIVRQFPRLQEYRTLDGHEGRVNDLALLPGERIIISASSDKTLKVWNFIEGSVLRTLNGHAGEINAVEITPDWQSVVSASSDKTLRVWKLDSGHTLFILRGHKGTVNDVAVFPDGRQAISASSDHTLKLWDIRKGIEVKTLIGHVSEVNSVVVTPDGNYVISASSDRTIKAWDVINNRCLITLLSEVNLTRITIAPDGSVVIAGDTSGTVYFFALENLHRGLPIVTAWFIRKSRFFGKSYAFACPNCNTWSGITKSALGTRSLCPMCNSQADINPFAVEGNWKIVSESWDKYKELEAVRDGLFNLGFGRELERQNIIPKRSTNPPINQKQIMANYVNRDELPPNFKVTKIDATTSGRMIIAILLTITLDTLGIPIALGLWKNSLLICVGSLIMVLVAFGVFGRIFLYFKKGSITRRSAHYLLVSVTYGMWWSFIGTLAGQFLSLTILITRSLQVAGFVLGGLLHVGLAMLITGEIFDIIDALKSRQN